MAHKTLAFFLMLLALVGLMFMAPQADRAPDAAHATDDVRPVFLQDLEGPAPDGSLLQAAAAGDGWVTVTWQQVQAG